MDTKGNEDEVVTAQSKDTLVGVAGQLLSNHISLLAIELEEVRQFYWRSLILLALCLGAGVLFFILLNIFIIMLFWDTDYRIAIMLSLLGINFLIALISGLVLMFLRKRTVLFPTIKEELMKDLVMFHDE